MLLFDDNDKITQIRTSIAPAIYMKAAKSNALLSHIVHHRQRSNHKVITHNKTVLFHSVMLFKAAEFIWKESSYRKILKNTHNHGFEENMQISH